MCALVALFIKDDKLQFTAHIDAPVEAELVILQKEIEGMDHGEKVDDL